MGTPRTVVIGFLSIFALLTDAAEATVEVVDAKIMRCEIVGSKFQEVEQVGDLQVGEFFGIDLVVLNEGPSEEHVINVFSWSLDNPDMAQVVGTGGMCLFPYDLQPDESALLWPFCVSMSSFTASRSGTVTMYALVHDWNNAPLCSYTFPFNIGILTNHAPAVSFASAPDYIYEGWTINLTATASDPDAGQSLTYSLTQTTGQGVTFGTASAPGSPLPAGLIYPFTLPARSLTSRANKTLMFSLTARDNGNPTRTSLKARALITACLAGDIDHDDAVILQDLKLLVVAWNSTPTHSNWNHAADLDGDGAIILSDLKLLVASWSRSVS